jgi:hypothetical protein
VVRASGLDLWVCHHFRVLPTDDRFKELSFRQKLLLFRSHEYLPTDDDLRYSSLVQRRARSESLPTGDLKRMGYTPEQIKRMKEQLEAAGQGSPNV